MIFITFSMRLGRRPGKVRRFHPSSRRRKCRKAVPRGVTSNNLAARPCHPCLIWGLSYSPNLAACLAESSRSACSNKKMKLCCTRVKTQPSRASSHGASISELNAAARSCMRTSPCSRFSNLTILALAAETVDSTSISCREKCRCSNCFKPPTDIHPVGPANRAWQAWRSKSLQ